MVQGVFLKLIAQKNEEEEKEEGDLSKIYQSEIFFFIINLGDRFEF